MLRIDPSRSLRARRFAEVPNVTNPAGEVIEYAVDDHDRIVAVNEAWDRFAKLTDSPGVLATAVLQSSLWDHVSDTTLRHLWRLLLAKVRQTREAIELSCRCDGPDVARDLRLDISSTDGATVVIRSAVVGERPREPLSVTAAADWHLTMCSWCNSIRIDVEWIELEAAVARLHLLPGPHHPQLTHGLCESCDRSLRASIA
jgi:hypothetical protein